MIAAVKNLIAAVSRMLAVSTKVITLDIDSTAIRLLEARGDKVTKWASVPIEPGEVEGEIVSTPKALGTQVRQLMASSDMKGKKVTASFSGLYSVSRIVASSDLPGGLVTSEAVMEVAREIMPVDTDKLYLSWQTSTTGEGVREIFVVGVPQDVIDAEVRALRGAGINPHILDLKTMALARIVNREQALILNIEPSSFDIVVVANGIPEIMRTIAWEQDKLTTDEKAEHLATTLELTVDFYNSRHPGTTIDSDTPIFITGQMSGDRALVEKLQAGLRYSFEPLAPPIEYPEDLPVSQYAVNIGLALKGKTPSGDAGQGNYSPPDINFLPAVYHAWKPSVRQLFYVVAVVAAVFLLFQLYQVTGDALAETGGLQRRYDLLNTKLQQRQLEIKNRAPLQQAVKEYHIISNPGGNFTEDLKVINSEATEHGVQLQSIAHGGDTITINWQVDSYDTIESYLATLEESGRFAVPIPRPKTGYPFITSGTTTLEPTTGGQPEVAGEPAE